MHLRLQRLSAFFRDDKSPFSGASNSLFPAYQREVDLIAQTPDRVLALFEIKALATVTNSDFRHAEWFFGLGGPAEAYKGGSFVVYLGDHLLPFSPRKIALPLSMFWSF